MEQAISPDTFDPAKHNGSFTISMSDYSVERIMPRLTDHMSRHAPSIRIDLTPYSVASLPDMFDRRSVDLAIGGYVNDESANNGIRMRELWSIHWSCLMRRSHPLATGPLTLERFLEARHLDVRCQDMQVALYDGLLAARGLSRTLVLTLNSYAPALAIIEKSDLIAILPTSLLDRSAYEDQIVSRDPPVPMPVRPYCVIWHRRWDSDPAHRWLRRTITSLFAKETGNSAGVTRRARGAAWGGTPKGRRGQAFETRLATDPEARR
jgi:DNA-binding transcriptional LysR family regulator